MDLCNFPLKPYGGKSSHITVEQFICSEIKIIQPLVVLVATGAGDTVRLMLVKTSLHGESFKGRTVFEEIAGRFLGYCGHVTL